MEKNKYAAQNKYQKDKMSIVSARFKNEFVEEFKEACAKLDITQADVIRDAMNKVIKKSKK